jgi:hypothetical protein
MAFVDPVTVQNPTVNVVATFQWGDAVNAAFNWLHAAKAGCLLSTAVGTALGTNTAIPFATETFDVNACHSTVINTERITVPTNWAGLWLVGADIAAGAGEATIWIRLNGTTKIVGQSMNSSGSTNAQTNVLTVWDAAVGDYFEVVVTGGSAIDLSQATNRFFGYWLHG